MLTSDDQCLRKIIQEVQLAENSLKKLNPNLAHQLIKNFKHTIVMATDVQGIIGVNNQLY